METALTNCTCCGHRLEPATAWKGRGQRFYCNEFCADHDDVPRSYVPEIGTSTQLRMRKAA